MGKVTLDKPRIYFLAGWSSALVAGFGYLAAYSMTPGEQVIPRGSWPVASQIHPMVHLPVLVVFLHPRCPCSRASVAELEKLAPVILGKAQIFVEFFKPSSVAQKWGETALWKRTKNLSGVVASFDIDGVEASTFGAKTSGQVFLFDENWKIVFQGGITPARGHEGDNVGARSIASFFNAGTGLKSDSKVFGCSLFHAERVRYE